MRTSLLCLCSLIFLSSACVSQNQVETNPSVENDFENTEKEVEVSKIVKTVAASNQGSHIFYDVYLNNGTQIHYDYYQSNHPLCPEQPKKCGEDSKDSGWDKIYSMIKGENFEKTKEPPRATYKPKESVCMYSKTSYETC